ncbi:hypothetical protein [Denitromonas iodatirespirans]|uniref:Uncharacterized protein n=1 Tax=Denitromonas iodatirespirans TaxID=2795389 RepID=A0A944H801_DENI1|nr:hypothetical protein [Denitromonas iodatirespirans]MBT0961704.1 hypothetical protein [Denitromonas iodatirespirans]
MIAPTEADQAAEMMLATYCRACGVTSPDDVRKAGEMMISKAARAIEKYNGAHVAVAVLKRTTLNLMPVEGGAAS